MRKLQLYIEGQRVDLFKDESVSITDSIQNVKDIEKVFTSFSQSFSVPANKQNNKIFKHYYNFDIVNGFDARIKVAARLEINDIPFKTGKIKLEGVDLKNNIPNLYRITFFGDIVSLKDKLGEKKLSDLNLTSYDLDYDYSTVYGKLAVNPATNDIICPLITHTQRLYYNSTTHTAEDGNLYYDVTHNHGVHWNQLKYAMRVNTIIEEIESQFDLTFSSDFFKDSTNKQMENLFLWLHRKSGYVEDLSGSTTNYTTLVDGWTPDTSSAVNFYIASNGSTLYSDVTYSKRNYLTDFDITLETTSTTDYTVEIYHAGFSFYTEVVTGGGNVNIDLTGSNYQGEGDYEVYITSASQITFSKIEWTVGYQDPYGSPDFATYDTGTFITNNVFRFNVSRQMPDITIISFLTGLFKLFNLTAYVEDNVIVVKPLIDYFVNPTTYDITDYVDISKKSVDNALPYKEVRFKFKDTKYFLANKFSELNNRTWGEIYHTVDGVSGSVYKVEAPFGHMLFERLNDGTTQKDIQWGWSVNDSQNAYLGAPLLFYPINVNTGGISVVDVDSDNNPVSSTSLGYVNLPFNTPLISPVTNSRQLNFNTEINEWTLDTSFGLSLFNEYYRTYIINTFDTTARMTKVTAYLPISILLNYELKDIFVINDIKYKINSITTDLLTGKSEIELLNAI